MSMVRKAVARARRLRGAMNYPESLLWEELRGGKLDGCKFRRQHPVGGYTLDFACVAARLEVEVDGGIHQLDHVADRDYERDANLARLGWHVLRLTDRQVVEGREAAQDAIRAELRLAGSFQHEGSD